MCSSIQAVFFSMSSGLWTERRPLSVVVSSSAGPSAGPRPLRATVPDPGGAVFSGGGSRRTAFSGSLVSSTGVGFGPIRASTGRVSRYGSPRLGAPCAGCGTSGRVFVVHALTCPSSRTVAAVRPSRRQPRVPPGGCLLGAPRLDVFVASSIVSIRSAVVRLSGSYLVPGVHVRVLPLDGPGGNLVSMSSGAASSTRAASFFISSGLRTDRDP